jgi:hypothetical protein
MSKARNLSAHSSSICCPREWRAAQVPRLLTLHLRYASQGAPWTRRVARPTESAPTGSPAAPPSEGPCAPTGNRGRTKRAISGQVSVAELRNAFWRELYEADYTDMHKVVQSVNKTMSSSTCIDHAVEGGCNRQRERKQGEIKKRQKAKNEPRDIQ